MKLTKRRIKRLLDAAALNDKYGTEYWLFSTLALLLDIPKDTWEYRLKELNRICSQQQTTIEQPENENSCCITNKTGRSHMIGVTADNIYTHSDQKGQNRSPSENGGDSNTSGGSPDSDPVKNTEPKSIEDAVNADPSEGEANDTSNNINCNARLSAYACYCLCKDAAVPYRDSLAFYFKKKDDSGNKSSMVTPKSPENTTNDKITTPSILVKMIEKIWNSSTLLCAVAGALATLLGFLLRGCVLYHYYGRYSSRFDVPLQYFIQSMGQTTWVFQLFRYVIGGLIITFLMWLGNYSCRKRHLLEVFISELFLFPIFARLYCDIFYMRTTQNCRFCWKQLRNKSANTPSLAI